MDAPPAPVAQAQHGHCRLIRSVAPGGSSGRSGLWKEFADYVQSNRRGE